MSFRLKIVLMTTSLIAILFGIGGVVLIHTSFQASLQKEEQSAVDSNELILRIVQYVGEDAEWFGENELVAVIENICTQDSIDSLRLLYGEESIFTYSSGRDISVHINQIKDIEENQVIITYFSADGDEKYIQTTTKFLLNNRTYYLDMSRNLTGIYQVRKEQIEVFQKTLLVLFFLGMCSSWIMATVMTRHLRKLTRASKEIGTGNMSYRTNIQSHDEIGELSQAFDTMAAKLEDNITLLKESAEQKEQFMGAFTHELKTPMTSIIGYADLLRTQKLNKRDEADALAYIFSEAKRLENMSLKMLDLFVADKNEISLKMCSPANLTYYVAKHLQNTYAKNNVKIEVRAEQGMCMLDADLYQTLLINLMDNAQKSMEKGGTVSVNIKMTETGCILYVADEGKGIPEAAMKHLTEAFYRVDKARARSKGSAGLGLALCDKIVQLHHGSMYFDSKEGIGTVVTVILNGGVDEEKAE